MHLLSSPHFLNVFNSKVVRFVTISVIFLGITWADKSPSYKARNQWSLKHSNPTSDGEFLNVPVYYGDWVPISSAKAQIESLASSVKAAPNNNRRKDENVAAPSSTWDVEDEFTSPVKSSFLDSDRKPHASSHHGLHQVHHPHHQVHEAEERVEIEHHSPTSFIGPRLPGQQSREPPVRHTSNKRPYNHRGRNQYRGGSSRRKHRPTNSDALTRLFGPSLGWNGNRRQHRKIPQPPQSLNSIPFVEQISSIFGPSKAPQTVTSTGSAALQTLETLGNHWPSLPTIRGSSDSDSSYVSHDGSESIFQPIVKVLPSPDLAQVRPFVILSTLARDRIIF